MNHWITFALIALFLGTCALEAQDLTRVKVEGGTIEGIVENEINIYKGIPFAAPPVGELRWKAPQSHEPWEGVLKCYEFGPSPIQGILVCQGSRVIYALILKTVQVGGLMCLPGISFFVPFQNLQAEHLSLKGGSS